MKKFISLIALILTIFLLSIDGNASEIVRQKNVATYVTFPIVKNDGTLITSAAGLDSEIDTFADGTAPNGFADCTNEATEIGSDGQYYLSLTQTEMNNDYIILQIKSTTTDAMVQTLLIRTVVGDPLNAATTDDGGTINVTSGKIDEVATLTGHTAQTGDAYARLGAPAGASVSADIAAIKSDTGAILTDTGTTLDGKINTIDDFLDTEIAAILADTNELQTNQGNWLTATGFSTHSAADVVTAMQAVAGDFKADVSGLATSAALATAQADLDNPAQYKATGFSTHSASDVWAVATRALTDKAGFSLSSTGITAIWDKDISGYVSAGYAGTYLVGAGSAGDPWSTALPGAYGAGTAGNIIGNYIDEAISGIDDNPWDNGTRTLTAGTKDSEIDAILADTGELQTNQGNWITATGFSTHSAADVADAVWDEAQSGHTTAGTFGKYLDSEVSSAGGGSSAADIADAVWDEIIADHAVAGSAGKKLDDLPTSGTGDWTADEKADILEALSVEDGSVATEADLDGILLRIKKSRGR